MCVRLHVGRGGWWRSHTHTRRPSPLSLLPNPEEGGALGSDRAAGRLPGPHLQEAARSTGWAGGEGTEAPASSMCHRVTRRLHVTPHPILPLSPHNGEQRL